MGEEEQLNGAGGRHVGRVHSWAQGKGKEDRWECLQGGRNFVLFLGNFVMLFLSLHPIAAGANLRTAGKAIGWGGGGAHHLVP